MVNTSTKTLLVITLVLCSALLSHGIRSEPGFGSSATISSETQQAVVLESEQSCEGAGEEECMIRRTLVAQTDYIYTQKHKP